MSRILHHVGVKDFKKVHQRKLDEQKEVLSEKIKLEEENKKIEEVAKPFKSDWRSNLTESEWSAISGEGPTNSTGQTFVYGGPGGPQATFSGIGGVEAHPSTVTINGETYDSPTYSQLAMQGYTPPLGGVQRQTQQTENERIDAEIRKLEEQIRQLTQQQNDAADEYLATEPQYTGWSEAEYTEKSNELGQKWGDKMWPLQKALKDNPSCVEVGNCEGTKSALMRMSEQMVQELADLDNQYKNQLDAFAKAQDTHRAAYEKKDLALETQKDALKAKIAELEKQRPINQQLDASQQAYPNLPLMNARVQPSPSNYDRVRDTVLDTLASVTNLDTAKNALRSYNDFLANPKGAGSSTNNPLDISNQVSDRDMSALRGAANSAAVRSAIDFAKQKNTPLAWNTAADALETSLNVATTETPGLNNTVKGTGTLDRERFIQSNGEDIRLNKTYAFRPGGSIANLEKSLLGKGLSALGIKLDTLGAGGISHIAGPVASASMLTNLKGDIYDAPAAYMQIKIDADTREKTQASQLAQQAVGRGPTPNRSKRRKKGMKESTTWERTKKHLKGA